MKFLNGLFNVVWFILGGIGLGLTNIFSGIVSIVLIIPIFFGIPGIYFKAISLVMFPAGKVVETKFSSAPLRNVLAIIFGGFFTFLMYCLLGLVLCITIVFIPLGRQCFKFAKYWLAPFGASIKQS